MRGMKLQGKKNAAGWYSCAAVLTPNAPLEFGARSCAPVAQAPSSHCRSPAPDSPMLAARQLLGILGCTSSVASVGFCHLLPG